MEQQTKIRDVYYLVFYWIIILACSCSVISQAPIIVANGTLKALFTYVPWLLAILYGGITSVRIYFKDLKIFLFPIIFFIYDKFISFFGIISLDVITYTYMVASFILFLGLIVGKNIDKKDFMKILKYYTYVVIAFSFYLYLEVFGRVLFSDVPSLSGIMGKNSIGVVILSGLALLLLNKDFLPKTKYVFIAFLLFMVIIIKSRTTMLVAVALLILKLFLGGDKVKGKVIYGAVLTIVAAILFSNDTFYNVVIKQVFLRGQEFTEENLEFVTSGR